MKTYLNLPDPDFYQDPHNMPNFIHQDPCIFTSEMYDNAKDSGRKIPGTVPLS